MTRLSAWGLFGWALMACQPSVKTSTPPKAAVAPLVKDSNSVEARGETPDHRVPTDSVLSPRKINARDILELSNLGLKAIAPAAKMRKVAGDTLVQTAQFSATVRVARTTDFISVRVAQGHARKTHAALELKTTKLPDGWVFTFQEKSESSILYFVWSRRSIDGLDVWCASTTSSLAQQSAAANFCRHLSKSL